jgi:hypothetical protein
MELVGRMMDGSIPFGGGFQPSPSSQPQFAPQDLGDEALAGRLAGDEPPDALPCLRDPAGSLRGAWAI